LRDAYQEGSITTFRRVAMGTKSDDRRGIFALSGPIAELAGVPTRVVYSGILQATIKNKLASPVTGRRL